MPTRTVESTHEAEPNHAAPKPGAERLESPAADQMQGAPGDVHARPNPATAGPAEALPIDALQNEDDANASADQDIDTAGTEYDDLSPTKSL